MSVLSDGWRCGGRSSRCGLRWSKCAVVICGCSRDGQVKTGGTKRVSRHRRVVVGSEVEEDEEEQESGIGWRVEGQIRSRVSATGGAGLCL